MHTQTNSERGFGHVGLLAGVVVLLVVGFAGWRVMNQKDESNQQLSVDTTTKTEDIQSLPDDMTDIKSLSEIQALASEQAAGLSIVGIELETEDNAAVYVVYLSDGTKLTYDARTAKRVVKSDDSSKSDNEQPIPAGFVAGITIQNAVDIAKKEHPNVKVKKVELETEDGVVVYSVRFVDDSRVDVSAKDGTIMRVKNENGDTTKDFTLFPHETIDHDSSSDDNSADDSNEDSDSGSSDDSNDDDSDTEDDGDDTSGGNSHSGSGSSDDD